MITDALELVPDALDYLNRLTDERVFRFCAIPQLMAIATLSKCYDNEKVLTGVVKIRRGQAALLIEQSVSLALTKSAFHRFAAEILEKVPASDPSAAARVVQR